MQSPEALQHLEIRKTEAAINKDIRKESLREMEVQEKVEPWKQREECASRTHGLKNQTPNLIINFRMFTSGILIFKIILFQIAWQSRQQWLSERQKWGKGSGRKQRKEVC